MSSKGTIIIVGASSGLGQAVARTYAERGWKVGVCARRREPLDRLAEEFPGQIFPAVIDVTASDSHRQFEDFIHAVGGMDILLYAAGCGWNNPELKYAEDERTVQTNVVGFTRIVNAAYLYFTGHVTPSGRRGQLCAITSIAGTKGIGISATYSATKKYQNTYLEALSQLARTRVPKKPFLAPSITDIRPGFIDTALLDTSAHRYPMLMSVPYACRRIVRAIDRRRKVAYIDWRWHAVVAGWKMLPRALWIRLKLKI